MSDQMELSGRRREFITKIWVREVNQGLRALRRRYALGIGPSELGDHEIRFGARRRHRPVEPWNNTRHLAFCRDRVRRDDRLAALRAEDAADKIELSVVDACT
jgi:hypothetical protein